MPFRWAIVSEALTQTRDLTHAIPEMIVLSTIYETLETVSYFFTWQLGKLYKPSILSVTSNAVEILLMCPVIKWKACYLFTTYPWFSLLGRWKMPHSTPTAPRSKDFGFIQESIIFMLNFCFQMKMSSFCFCCTASLKMHILSRLFDVLNFL